MGDRLSGVKRDPAEGWMLLGQLTQGLSERQGSVCQALVILTPSQAFHPWEELTWLVFALSHILLRAVALDLWRLDYLCFPKALSGSAWRQTCSAGDPPVL